MQFHGYLGKSAAQMSEAETLPSATVPPNSFSLNAYERSGRRDGALFALMCPIQLWTRSNHHWYLKHKAQADLHQPLVSEAVPSMMWHPEIPLCLYFTTSGCIKMRKFAWESWANVALKPNNTGAVAVLDGCIEAAVSGCKQALIVLFSESYNGKLCNGILIQTFHAGNNQEHRGDNEAYWESDPVYLYAAKGELWSKLSALPKRGLILIQTSTGILKQVCHGLSGLGSSFATEDFSVRFPKFCTVFRILNTAYMNNLSDLYCMIGLTQLGKIYINQELFVGNCSSFTLDLQYVIY
ncbi:hypothetical protein O181_108841 [Austropuccinia psidii MF-1]|uniref:ELP1 N-terminal second beta-propeller domain-containing protein n=1 Tax=Austropuccinia psidii MF-1 TaxID=1389203 RepID=A0A9Q3JW28_9BASI|nr:hypothetical protein [Austropuccinia psidii MF-1]